jgi:hypothetical protein
MTFFLKTIIIFCGRKILKNSVEDTLVLGKSLLLMQDVFPIPLR